MVRRWWEGNIEVGSLLWVLPHGVKEAKEAKETRLMETGGTEYPPGDPSLIDDIRSLKTEQRWE